MTKIQLKFYCIQPISYRREDLRRIILSKTTIDKIREISVKEADISAWFRDFQKFHRVYDSFFVIHPDRVDAAILKHQLEDHFWVNGKSSLAPHLKTSEVKSYMIYDYRLMYFNLIYELPFEFKLDDLPTFLRVNPDAASKMDLYNTVRNLLVKEKDTSVISDWADQTRSAVKRKIRTILNRQYRCKCGQESLRILNNTGNITNVVVLEGASEEQYNNSSQGLVQLNDAAERLSHYSDPLYLEDGLIYHFNGRFHTIILKNRAERHRYMPIQFHIQFIWFYLNRIIDVMERLNGEIIGNDAMENIEHQNRLIDILIHKAEILTLHNANFKTSIEVDNERIYRSIRSKWNIDQLLRTSNRYINFFKDYLRRIYVRKTSKIEQRQNVILAFISVLQLIALISVWNDYIALLNEDNLAGISKQMVFFNWIDLKYIMYFNLVSPILIIGVIICLLLFFRKR